MKEHAQHEYVMLWKDGREYGPGADPEATSYRGFSFHLEQDLERSLGLSGPLHRPLGPGQQMTGEQMEELRRIAHEQMRKKHPGMDPGHYDLIIEHRLNQYRGVSYIVQKEGA